MAVEWLLSRCEGMESVPAGKSRHVLARRHEPDEVLWRRTVGWWGDARLCRAECAACRSGVQKERTA